MAKYSVFSNNGTKKTGFSPDSLDDLVRLAKVFELIVVSSVPPGTGGIGCPGTGFRAEAEAPAREKARKAGKARKGT